LFPEQLLYQVEREGGWESDKHLRKRLRCNFIHCAGQHAASVKMPDAAQSTNWIMMALLLKLFRLCYAHLLEEGTQHPTPLNSLWSVRGM
jgi:hypothetical protein